MVEHVVRLVHLRQLLDHDLSAAVPPVSDRAVRLSARAERSSGAECERDQLHPPVPLGSGYCPYQNDSCSLLVTSGSSAYSGPGFVGWDDGGPTVSPANPLGPNDTQHNQWTALKSFVSMAQMYGIWVNLEFVPWRVQTEVDTNQISNETGCGENASTVGAEYAGWVNTFIANRSTFQNVLIWGLDYSIPGPGESSYAPFWSAAYPTILSEVQQTSYPSGRPLLMVSSNFYGAWQSQYVQPILNPGYQWTTQAAQQTPSLWQQDGDTPDLYSFQMYNASAEDLEAALESAASAIPFSKMIVTEVA